MGKRWKARTGSRVALPVALIALFVALGGGATAAQKVLFTGKDIKDHSVAGRDIRARTIGPKHLNRRVMALLESAASIEARTVVTGAKGPKGDPGPRGPKGDAGQPGARGPRGVSCYEIAADKKKLAANIGGKKLIARCRGPRGKRGPAGPEGPAGPSGASGLAAPMG